MGAILLVLLGSGLLRNRFLSAQRQGENVETFVEFLEFYGFDPEIARSAYQYLEQEEGLAFPIRYSDFLEEDLRLSDEEVRQMVLHLLRTFGRVPQFGMRHAPLLTVEHVLRFVQACPFEAIMRSSGQGVDRSLSSAYRAAFRTDESSGSIMAATMANTRAAVLGKLEGVEFPRVRLEMNMDQVALGKERLLRSGSPEMATGDPVECAVERTWFGGDEDLEPPLIPGCTS